MHERRGRFFWAATIASYERSGLSHGEFCERQGLVLGTFRSWLYRIRAEGDEATVAPTQFVEVVGDMLTRAGPACGLRFDDLEVSFLELPPPEYLAAVVRHIADTP